MKQWNLVLKDFLEDSITKMWTMSCWTLTASQYFRFFFYILYGHNTYNVLKKGIYDTIIPFTFHLANELHPKKRWARWVMAYPWAVLKSVDRPVAPVVPQMLGHIWTCGLTNWLHRPGTFASFIGTRWPALFWGVGEVKGESWRLGGGK